MALVTRSRLRIKGEDNKRKDKNNSLTKTNFLINHNFSSPKKLTKQNLAHTPDFLLLIINHKNLQDYNLP
jgi:hypothetical protein